MDRRALKEKAKNILKTNFGIALLAYLIVMIILGALNVLPIVGSIASLVLAGPLLVGATSVYAALTAEEPASLDMIFRPLQDNFVNTFVANLLSGLFVFLWSFLLIIPGIIKSYSYAMVNYLLVKEPQLAGMEALHRSEELMRGHRMELFVLQLSFIGWILLCCITFGIAGLWVTPYMNLTQTAFFDKIYGVKTPDEILGHNA